MLNVGLPVVAYILCQLSRPKEVWLLRGNHECRQMTAFFNFRDECRCSANTARA